ncbi:MAG: hypothetical protein GKR91_09725 [Pseudomonadales bacterium]|nr:hypothetical protein [Pseudomonadales bacterium]
MLRFSLLIMLTISPINFALADLIDGEELIDPTRPIFVTGDGGGDLGDIAAMIRDVIPASYELSFVRASESSPMAVINEQRVTIGDVIGGATVVSIDRDGVVLSVNEQERRISLFGSNVKTPVGDQ